MPAFNVIVTLKDLLPFASPIKLAVRMALQEDNSKRLTRIDERDASRPAPRKPQWILVLFLALFAACKNRSEPLQKGERTQNRKSVEIQNQVVSQSGEGSKNQPINQMGHHEYLELILHNSTSGNIDETAIILGERPCTFGIVGMGVSKGYLGWDRPVGTNAVVQWRDSNKNKREMRVDISAAYNPVVTGQLMFTIAGTNVTVDFKVIDRK